LLDETPRDIQLEKVKIKVREDSYVRARNWPTILQSFSV